MAESKKITQEQVYEKDLFNNLSKSGKKAEDQLKADLKAVTDLSKGLKILLKDQEAILKTSKKGIVDSAKLNEGTAAIKKTNAAIKGLDATEKQRLKLLAQLKQANSDRIQKNEELKLQLAQQKKTNKELAKQRLEEVGALKKVTKLTTDQKNAIKDLEIIQSKTAGTLEKLDALNRRLRAERKKLNLETEKGRLRLKAINLELDKNNKKITDNSDKLKKQKLNVGNYTDSIKDAAEQSGLFGGVLGKLNQIQGVLNALLKKNTIEEEVNTVAKETNTVATTQLTVAQRASNAATTLGTKGLKAFKIALASTGIGLLVIAVGAIIALFTRFQGGIDALSNGMAGLSAGVDVVIDRFQQVGEGMALVFKGLKDFDYDTVAKGMDLIAESTKGIADEMAEEVAIATKLNELTIKLTREQKIFQAQQASSLTDIKRLTIVVKDKLALDEDRLKAVKEINKIELEVAARQIDLQEQALAASFETLSADRERLELTKEEIQFVDDLKNGRLDVATAAEKAKDFTLGRSKAEEALFGIIDKIKDQEQARQSLLDKQSTTAKRTAAITREIANKNSKALLAEANFQKELAKDVDETLRNRILAIQEINKLTVEAAALRRDANIINEQEFQAIRLTEEKRAEEAIQKLQLEGIDDTAKKKEDKQRDLDAKLLSNATKQRQLENEALEAQLNEQLELQKKKEEEALAFKKDIANKSVDATKAEIDKKNKAIAEQLDSEIANREDAVSTQQQRAEQGLENTLAFEQQKLAEAEKAKLEQAKREEQQKRAILLSEAFLKAYIAELGQPDADSLKAGFKAASGVLIADGLGKAIAGSAFDGIEDTGIAGDGDSKGGKLWMLHPHERVMDRNNNDKTGGMSNDNLADLAFDFRNGNLIKSTDAQQVGYKIDNNGVELAIKGMKGDIVQAINDKPIQHVNVSDLGNLIETVYKNGSKITTTHKLRNRFK